MKITCSMCTAKRMIPRGAHSTQFESFLIVSTKTGKKKIFENQCQTSFHVGLECRFSNVRESHRYAYTAGMLARDVAGHFQRHESTINRLPNRFQQTGNVADRPRSGRPRKTTPREDRFPHDFMSTQQIPF